MRLLANGVEVAPAYSVARPTLELRSGQWRRGSTQLRYYYPMSVLASSGDGSRPELAPLFKGNPRVEPRSLR